MLRYLSILSLSILCVSCSCGNAKQSLHNRQDRLIVSDNASIQSRPQSTNKRESQEQSSLLEIPIVSKPLSSQILKRDGYVLSYNPDTRNCNWVAYELTREEANGEIPRDKNFYEDFDVARPRATKDDYKGSGWSRGHMAPAGDMKWSENAMYQSCLFTNICPQDASLNSGAWESVEKKCRSLAKQKGRVFIVCGPLYNGPIRTIGANNVRVPDSFFKVILVPDGQSYSCVGFIFPNEPVAAAQKNEYAFCVDDVEKICGMDFFSKLPDTIENDIESKISWSLVN